MKTSIRMVLALITLALITAGVRAGGPGGNAASTTAPPVSHHGDEPQDTPSCTQTGSVLNCSGLGFSTFPLSAPPDITSLDLSANELTSLKETPLMLGLLTLNLHHNKISHFGGSPFHHRFPRLRELNVSDNGLTSFPRHLPEMLSTLDIGRNKLTSVDNLPLQNLEEFYVNHNHIEGPVSVCDAGLTGCHAGITKLDLSHNRITELTEGGLSGLGSLEVLSLAGNRLIQVNKYLFTGLKSVVFLDLSHNHITAIEEDTFKAMRTLKFLYLRSNRLTVIPGALPLLEWLDVSHNALVTVNETLKSALYPIELVNLAHNPLRCDCHLLWLKVRRDAA